MSDYFTKVSPRELRVLELVAQGESNEQIASRLALSSQAVARNLSVLMTRMHVPNRAALVARAYTQRILHPSAWPPVALGVEPPRAEQPRAERDRGTVDLRARPGADGEVGHRLGVVGLPGTR